MTCGLFRAMIYTILNSLPSLVTKSVSNIYGGSNSLMKIVHVCLSMGYTEGLNYQENVIIKYQAGDGHDVTLITTDHCFHEGEWGLCQTEVTISIRMAFIL